MTVSGYVGRLQLGVATAADVQRFAGVADFIGTGTFEVPNTPTFLALGYGCSSAKSAGAINPTAYRPSHTNCRTVYFINNKSGTFGAFWTSSQAFHTFYGTHPGSAQSYVNQHEDALPEFGCRQGDERSSAVADLLIETRGGHPFQQTRHGITYVIRVEGGVVNDLQLEAADGGVGLMFC